MNNLMQSVTENQRRYGTGAFDKKNRGYRRIFCYFLYPHAAGIPGAVRAFLL